MIAALLLLIAGSMAIVGLVEDNRATLDTAQTLALVGVGVAMLSFRDQT